MCFSATASFIAGATLSVVGLITIKKAQNKRELPFASIPLLFGIQQLIEGAIWLTFTHNNPAINQILTYVYSVFSHGLWPMYIPFSIALLEHTGWRKNVINVLQVTGIIVGLYLLYYIFTEPVVAHVMKKHIVYMTPHFYIIPVMIIYLLATCVTCFFSSHKFIRYFGILMLVSFSLSYYIHVEALVSVWCFFAAALSFLIFLHFESRKNAFQIIK